jgi:hypothetical protein
MRSALIAGAATLVLSAGSAFAADASSATTGAARGSSQAPLGMYVTNGYVFPGDGSPSGEWVAPAVPQRPAQTTGHFAFSHVYLYPPAQGNDGNSD